MRFTVSNEALIGPLQIVGGIIEKRHSNKILSNVLLSVDENTLTLTAANSEIEMVTRLHLEDSSELQVGEVTVPAKKLLDICKSIKGEQKLVFSLSENRATLKAGRSRFSLITQAANEFPSIQEPGSDAALVIEQEMLKDLFDYTQFAMAQQDVRFYLNGLLVEINANTIRTVATDGHRMAMASRTLEASVDTSLAVIIPRKGITELSKLLSEGPVKLSFDDNHLFVFAEHFSFTSKLVDGRFPDYNKVILKDVAKTIVLNREEFKEALSQASILCNEKFRGVRLVFEAGKVTLFSNNPEQEEAEIQISSDYSGEAFEMGFNVNYLLDVLQIVRTENVRLSLDEQHSNTLFEEQDGKDCKYVVMPMRL